MSYRAQRLPAAAAVLGLTGALTGCVPEGLAFKLDERLTFSAPKDRATVTLPLTLDWDIRDFDIVPPGGRLRENAGYFAVFVDESPMPPGRPLSWIARKDRGCQASDGCPDGEYLATRGIYTTTETTLTVEQLPRSRNQDRRERHRATVVLIDPAGNRIGESAFELTFDVDRAVAR